MKVIFPPPAGHKSWGTNSQQMSLYNTLYTIQYTGPSKGKKWGKGEGGGGRGRGAGGGGGKLCDIFLTLFSLALTLYEGEWGSMKVTIQLHSIG